jgi:hypothetical protein
MLTKKAIAFARLGYLVRDFNESKDSTPITDPEIEASIRQRLTPKVGAVKRVFALTFTGDEADFEIRGKAEQPLNAIKSQFIDFRVTPDKITYKLANAKEASEFAETPEFARSRKKSKLRCNPGNIQCGGKCQDGDFRCNAAHSPEEKKGWGAIAAKIKAFIDRITGKKSKKETLKQTGTISHKDLIESGAKALPKQLQGDLDNLKTKLDSYTQLKEKIVRTPKGVKRDDLIDQHDLARDSLLEANKKAVEGMSSYRKSLIESATVEEKKAAKQFIQKLYVDEDNLDKESRREIIGEAREFALLTGGKGSSTLRYMEQIDERAYALESSKMINLGIPPDKATTFHEMAHHIEYENPELAKAAGDWVRERATSNKPQSLNKLEKTDSYDKDEIAYPDKFLAPYVGKVYENGTTEVISMGVERFSSPESMVSLYTSDREHFNFTLGVLKRRD